MTFGNLSVSHSACYSPESVELSLTVFTDNQFVAAGIQSFQPWTLTPTGRGIKCIFIEPCIMTHECVCDLTMLYCMYDNTYIAHVSQQQFLYQWQNR